MSSKKLALILWFLATIFYAYQYVIRVLPNVLMQPLMQKYAINPEDFGNFAAIYYSSYVAMHVPIGLMLDRFGPKFIMPISIILVSFGLTPLIFSNQFEFALFSRFIVGVGSSAAILCVFKIVRTHFKSHEFSKMLGLAAVISLSCAALGGRPVGFLLERTDWNSTIFILILTGLILAILTFFILPKSNISNKNLLSRSEITKVLLNKKVILISVIGGLMVSPMEGFADAWGNEFLKIVHLLDKETSQFLPSMVLLGYGLASPFLGILAINSKRSFFMLTICCLLMLLAFGIIIFLNPISASFLGFFLLLGGVGSAYQLFITYFAITFVPEHLSGVASSFSNMLLMMFGILFHKIIGWILLATSKHDQIQSFKWAVSIIPFCLIISFFLILACRKNFINSKD